MIVLVITHMEKQLSAIEYTNFNLCFENYLESIQKLRLAISHGYLSYENLLLIEPILPQLQQLIVLAREQLLNPNRTSLYAIMPVLDNLKLFLNEQTLGAVCLVSKEISEAMILKCGIDNVNIYVAMYNLKTNTDTNIDVPIFFGDEILEIQIPQQIIKKRHLRTLLGPEKYFKDRRNNEIFFMSDLEYLLSMFANKGICLEICIPRTICIVCKKIKSISDTHDNCFDTYLREKNLESSHNKNAAIPISNHKNKKQHKNFYSAYDDNDHNDDYTNTDNGFYSQYLYGNRSKNDMIKPICSHRSIKRLYMCEYMYPELVFYAEKNNFFPVPPISKSQIILCENKYPCCDDCYYIKYDLDEIPNKAHYSQIYHKKIWDYFKKNQLPADINKCKSIFKIPPECITANIGYLTPCETCKYPFFFHNICYDS